MAHNISTMISKFDVVKGKVSTSTPNGLWIEFEVDNQKLFGFAYYSRIPNNASILASVHKIHNDLIVLNVDSVLEYAA